MNKGFSGLEKLSLVDYDGHLSCTLFTSGCNFRCSYCHNSPLMVNQPNIDFEEIKSYLKKRKGVLDAVVISGGEPTLVPNLKEYITEIKSMGYLVKLDTNGTMPNVVRDLIENKLIDYVAMDIKNSLSLYDDSVSAVVDTSKIKETINLLINGNIDYEFRTTLVEEYHSEDAIEEIGVLLKGAKKMFLQKFNLRETVLDQNLHEVDIETANKYTEILKKNIPNVFLRGYK